MMKIFKNSKKRFHSEKGFTLMEMTVAMIVLSLITVVMSPFIHIQIRSYLDTRDSKYVIQIMRIGMNRILNEIADARNNSSSSDIATFNSSEFQFRNVDGDEVEIKYGTFSYHGRSTTGFLFRHTSKSYAIPLIPDGTSDCRFTYLDQNRAVTTVRSDIRLVRIRITCSYNGKTYSIENQIAPPNFQT